MANRSPLPPEDRIAIGAAVMQFRRDGVDWKLLEDRYDRSRVSLWRYVLAAMTADTTADGANETLFPANETSPA
jgi:hypothetical protein